MPDSRGVLGQPKRLALLAYLALATPLRPHRRDSLVALFWPESDSDQARHSLRQALHALRRALGADVILTRGDGDVAYNPDALWCDAHAFERALEAGDLEQAMSLYRGDMLDGFFVSDVSPELERWMDAERARLKSRAASAAWTIAERASQSGDEDAAADWARRAFALSPDDESALRRFVTMLDAFGDRAGALRAHDDFARRLFEDFEAQPSPETRVLIDAIRSREESHSSSPNLPPRPRELSSQRVERMAVGAPAAPARWRRRGVLFATGAIVTVAFAWLAMANTRGFVFVPRDRRPVIAVGYIDDEVSDTTELSGVMRELLATDLARVNGVQVVSHGRLLELLGQAGDTIQSPRSLTDAARRAGATERLEGALFREAADLRLDLRRVDVRSGVVLQAYTLHGNNAFDIAAQAATAVARGFALATPARPAAGTSTTSLAARRLFEEGLRAYHQRVDLPNAHRLFVAALAEDSSFAMAAYYAFLSRLDADPVAATPYLVRALQLSSRSDERDRLLIRLAWAEANNDVRSRAIAESLVARYPTEPASELALANAISSAGDFLEAAPHYRNVVARDSLSLLAKTPLCRACDALAQLISLYIAVDSFAAAERVGRQWVRLQPGSSRAWYTLATVMGEKGNRRAADSLKLRAAELQPEAAAYPLASAIFAIKAEDFRDADRMLLDRLQYGTAAVREDATWWLLISRRNQGRLNEALVLANAMFRMQPNQRAPFEAYLARGQVLFEMGRFRESAALFDSLAAHPPPLEMPAPGRLARYESWMLTHAATAWAAAGDTQRLAPIAARIEELARSSAYGRDRKLPHHVRGLLWVARERPQLAAEEFRRAIYSITYGYTRTNLELGRVLLSLRKPRETIEILRPALHGSTESSNFYVTRVEIHELLAKAFEMAGERDSAIAHYRVTADAWRQADPLLAPRGQAARVRQHRLEARR